MNVLCKIFGHKPPVYAKSGWHSPGEHYVHSIQRCGVDGTGREHAELYSRCPRCCKVFYLARIHIPEKSK